VSNVNKVILVGRVGSDPELKSTGGGKKLAKLSLATSRKINDKEQTQWHRVTLWERLAEVVEKYVHKGDLIYVEGRIEYSQTEDDKGNTRFWTDVVAYEMQMLGSKKDKGEPSPFDTDDSPLPF
jgi:single-strand DNA-binding protein